MQKRIISAIFMILLVVPIIYAGKKVFSIAVGLLAVLSLKELIDLKNSHHKIPSGLILYSVLMLVILVFYEYQGHAFSYGISQRLLILMLIGYLLPTLIVNKENTYLTSDAMYLFGSVIFLGITFNSLILIRKSSLLVLIYLILIPIITDTFAYLIGSLIGKKKLAPKISPHKTIEGFIGGLLCATIIGGIYYYFTISSKNFYVPFFMSLILSLFGQIGDLIFSKIKRENDIKDFSNLIPGHGGVLDRIDSFIIVLLVYIIMIKFI